MRKLIKVGQELIVGQQYGFLQVFDIENLKKPYTQEFNHLGDIYDITPIEQSELLLLAGEYGVLKVYKGHALKHCFKGMKAYSICHIAESFYLVGFKYYGVILWNEETDQ